MPISTGSVLGVANVLRERRRELGLSQTEAAERAGVSREWISKFESGRARAEFRLVLSLITALDLNLMLVSDAERDRLLPQQQQQVDLDALLASYQASG